MPDAQLFAIHMMDDHNSNFNAIIHLLSTGYEPKGLSTNQKKHLVVKAANYTLIVGHLYNLGMDKILHRCVFDHKIPCVMSETHAGVTRGHYARTKNACKILQAGLWWPTIDMDTNSFCRCCDICQRTRKLLHHKEMPLVQ